MKQNLKFLPLFLLLAGFAAGLVSYVPPSAAQTASDYNAVLDRLEQIEKELRALQRSAARGRLSSGASGETQTQGSSQPQLLADMEVRIARLEREIRGLTGQIEELVYRQDKLEAEMDLFRQDIEFQLRDITPASTLTPPAQTPSAAFGNQAKDAVAQPVTLPAGSVEERYNFAFAFLQRGDYPGAQAAFEAFLAAHPDNPLAGNAQYWLGETFYVRKNYPRAAAAFLKGFQSYADNNKGPDNLLKLGMTLNAMGQAAEACTALEELDARYPEANSAIKAQTRAQQERLGCG